MVEHGFLLGRQRWSSFRQQLIVASSQIIIWGRIMRLINFALALVATVFIAQAAAAQSYPNKPVRLIVPYPAGGAVDIVSRTLGHHLSETWKQQVVIENRPGAGGVIATEVVAKAPADGYTLLIVANGHALGPYFYAKLPFDTFKDFTSVVTVGYTTNILLVAKTTPVNTTADLIALAKSKPGQISYGHAGNGTSPHLAGELFKAMAKVDIVAVPYKGGAPAINDLVAGQIPMTFNNVPEALEHIRAGTIRALGVTTEQRSPFLPELPAIAETVPGFDSNVWWGMFGPAGLPKDVVAKLNKDINDALKAGDVKDRLAKVGAIPLGGTTESLDKRVRADYEKWGPIIKAAGIKAE
jgi:tripartite-type tricarboxylate transporter receptor subunit TctC